MKNGILYCVGLGPGDPDLITLKAWHILCRCPVLAVPQNQNGRRTALQILLQAAAQEPGLALTEKEMLFLSFPMTRELKVLAQAHRQAADQLLSVLRTGRSIALITLGCPTIYATCLYVERLVKKAGIDTVIVPGITSFSAAAARVGEALCEKEEPLLIVPASRSDTGRLLRLPGNKVLMKGPHQLQPIKDLLQQEGLLEQSVLVERCGFADEKVYPALRGINGNSYFSVILVKERKADS